MSQPTYCVRNVLADSGLFIGLFDADDEHHRACREFASVDHHDFAVYRLPDRRLFSNVLAERGN